MTDRNEAARILCVGLSHRTAPVHQRERFADLAMALGAIDVVGRTSASECVLLSTCNRVEWYLAVHDLPEHIMPGFCAQLGEHSDLPPNSICDAITVYEGTDAIHHLFSVAAGLDSMVVGESEIMGQVSRAYTQAIEESTVGPVLDALFRSAIRTGKRVRSETDLGSNPASVSSVALDLAARKLGNLAQQRILVIGMGEMGMLTLKLLRARGARHVVLVNRTMERAESLAHPDWQVRPLGDLPSEFGDVDLVISATSASQPIIRVQDIAQAAVSRNGPASSRAAKPLVVIDLAVPRDVEPAVANLPGVTLYDLDGLNQSIDRSLTMRERAIPAAECIIAEELTCLQMKLRELEVRPLVVELRSRAETIREQELARTLRFLGDVEPDTVNHLQHLTRALVNKLLHAPTVRIKERAHGDLSDEYLDTVCDLFDLDGTTPPL